MAIQEATQIISSDSHMLEPADLWVERLDRKYRDQAPHLYWDDANQGWFFGGEGIPPFRAAGLFGAGKTAEELKAHYTKGYEAARAGGWDPAERLKDMAIDGVAAEVLYTSLGFNLFWIEDAAYQEACFRVYNDWLAEFVNYAPRYFVGLGLISLWDIDHGVQELRRCRKIGLKGAMIWASPPEEQSFTTDLYDPFWAAAEELQMPISLHIITGLRESKAYLDDGPRRYQRTMSLPTEVQRTLSDLIFSGVLQRFPRLQIVSAEADIGWIAYYLHRADRAFKRYSHLSPIPLSRTPSECFQQQIWATFMNDPVGLKTVPDLGADRFMWSNDHPHQASTWPHSQEVITRDFQGLSEADRRKIVHDNCAKLYGFEL